MLTSEHCDYAAIMADLGYNVRSQVCIDGGYYFSKDVESIRTGKVYVCKEGYQSALGMIEFRSYIAIL